MKTVLTQTILYDIDDLKKPENKHLKARVLDKYNDINTSHEWYDNIEDDIKEELKQLGFYNVDMRFSGFWSQGDGASITGEI